MGFSVSSVLEGCGRGGPAGGEEAKLPDGTVIVVPVPETKYPVPVTTGDGFEVWEFGRGCFLARKLVEAGIRPGVKRNVGTRPVFATPEGSDANHALVA